MSPLFLIQTVLLDKSLIEKNRVVGFWSLKFSILSKKKVYNATLKIITSDEITVCRMATYPELNEFNFGKTLMKRLKEKGYDRDGRVKVVLPKASVAL